MFQELEITSKNLEIEPLLFMHSLIDSERASIPSEELAALWKRSPYSCSFSDIIKMEYSSAIYQPNDFRNMMFKEESYKSERNTDVSERILRIVEKIKNEEDLFKEIDKNQSLKTIKKIINGTSLEFTQIDDSELLKRIKRVLELEAMSGILKTLDPAQMEIFDKAVKRRPLFK